MSRILKTIEPDMQDDVEAPSTSTHWRVSKEIPVALVVSLLIQTAVIVWWASGLTKDVASVDKVASAAYPAREATLQQKLDDQIDASQDERIVSLSERIKTIETWFVKPAPSVPTTTIVTPVVRR